MPVRKVTVSELRNKTGTLMAELEEHGKPLIVALPGKPKAVLVRYDEYEALVKKVEDLEDILVMKEALSSPGDEAISLEKYLKQRERLRG